MESLSVQRAHYGNFDMVMAIRIGDEGEFHNSLDPIHQFHKSQDTPAPYPRMLHSEEKCAHCAHFCSDWGILGYGTGAFLDLWIRYDILMQVHIDGFVQDYIPWSWSYSAAALLVACRPLAPWGPLRRWRCNEFQGQWASYQIRKVAVAHALEMPGTFSPLW